MAVDPVTSPFTVESEWPWSHIRFDEAGNGGVGEAVATMSVEPAEFAGTVTDWGLSTYAALRKLAGRDASEEGPIEFAGVEERSDAVVGEPVESDAARLCSIQRGC